MVLAIRDNDLSEIPEQHNPIQNNNMIISLTLMKLCGNIFLSSWMQSCNPEQSLFSKKLKNYKYFVFILKTIFWNFHVFHPVTKVLCRRCVCVSHDFSASFVSELLKHLGMLCSP